MEGDLQPVVDFLLGLGLDKSTVAGIILRHPAVLCYSVEERLKPLVEYLVEEMQLPKEQVRRACSFTSSRAGHAGSRAGKGAADLLHPVMLCLLLGSGGSSRSSSFWRGRCDF